MSIAAESTPSTSGASRAARLARVATAALAVLLLPVSCASSEPDGNAAASVTVHDQWVKAADSGMSAAFAEITNDGDRDIVLVSATSAASSRMELHETVTDSSGTKTMRPKEGGFTIPAGQTLTLAPGGDHLMFMDLKEPLRTGSNTSIELHFADGSTTAFTARVRDFSGAQENYAPDTEHHGHHASTTHDG